MKIHGNDTHNAKPDDKLYIIDDGLRKRVNNTIEAMGMAAKKARDGDRFAEADYHRLAADLLMMRPALLEGDDLRQQKNAAYLRDLADRLDKRAIDSKMRESA